MKDDIQVQNGLEAIFAGLCYSRADLNKLILPGRHRIASCTNGPKTDIYGVIDCIVYDSNNLGTLVQVFYETPITVNIANIYIRYRSKGMATFTDWKLLYNVS